MKNMEFIFGIPTFFLVISILFTYLLFFVASRSKKLNADPNTTINLCLIIMIASLIGARGLHIVWEEPQYYIANPAAILEISRGGFVYFGGALCAFFSSLVFLKFRNESWKLYADVFTIPASLGTALGRVGCLLVGCCYGSSCNLPWAINQRHPTQIYSLLWDLCLTGALSFIEKRKLNKNTGDLFLIWIIWHSIGRILIEQFRDDFRGPIYGLSISSWISLAVLSSGITSLYLSTRASSNSELHKPHQQ